MDIDKNEYICNKCEHKWVCMYRNSLIEMAGKMDTIAAYYGKFSYNIICPQYMIRPNSYPITGKENSNG